MFDRFLETERFGSLDGLRAFSILAVLWHHSGLPRHGLPILERGQTGVYLFFAISGFLITSLLIRERRRTGTISMRGFYIRRSLRIFPLYYAVLLAYVLLVSLFERGEAGQQFFTHLPFFATYTSNWFVPINDEGRTIFYFAWSLATEEQFYLAWPWIERYVKPAVRRIILGAVIAVVAAVHFGFTPVPADSLAHTMLWSIAPPILFGVAVAHILHTRRGFSFFWSLLGHRWSAPFAAAIVLGLLTLPHLAHPMLHNYAIYLMLTVLVVACVIREDNGLSGMLKLPPLVRLGVVSYGVYLMHMLCFNAVRRVGPMLGLDNAFVLWVLGIAIVYVVAEISFATFERFFQSLRPRSRPTTGALA
ncbi:MAG: acyltransferase [Steroidobacteraceae bacterium]